MRTRQNEDDRSPGWLVRFADVLGVDARGLKAVQQQRPQAVISHLADHGHAASHAAGGACFIRAFASAESLAIASGQRLPALGKAVHGLDKVGIEAYRVGERLMTVGLCGGVCYRPKRLHVFGRRQAESL